MSRMRDETSVSTSFSSVNFTSSERHISWAWACGFSIFFLKLFFTEPFTKVRRSPAFSVFLPVEGSEAMYWQMNCFNCCSS